jgi:L-arabinonolactonase
VTEPVLAAGTGDLLGEGPRWDHRDGCLYWVDVEGRRLHRLRPDDGEVTTWDVPAMPASVALRASGGLVVATDRGLEAFHPAAGGLETIVALEPDRPGNRANDGGVDPHGRFWVGTMARAGTRRSGALYRCGPDGAVEQVLDGLGIPNTVVWSRDGAVLYFAETLDRTIHAYDVDPDDGSLSGRRVFARTEEPALPDGSALDAEGCLWNAEWDGGRVVRYTPDGAVDRVVEMPVARPTCCAFGGTDLDTLYVTSARTGLTASDLASQPGAGGLFALDVGVAGIASTEWDG